MGKLEKEFNEVAKKYLQREEERKSIQHVIKSMDREKKINTVASELFAVMQLKLDDVHSDIELTNLAKDFLQLSNYELEDFKNLFKNNRMALDLKIVRSCIEIAKAKMSEDMEDFNYILQDIVIKRTQRGIEV